MAEQTQKGELKSTGYELFILLLSMVSIVNLVLVFVTRFIVVDSATLDTVELIDAILTPYFLFDFGYRLLTAPSKSTYFFKRWGWADLLACIPLLRVFRLFRIVRAVRQMRTYGLERMVDEVLFNRAGNALYITVFSVIVLAEIAAIMILKAEARNPAANLTTAGDAVWWVFVTITTVGYGDFFPTTSWGRVIGVGVMFCGIALLAVLTSFLATFFIAPRKKAEERAPHDPVAKLAEIEALLDAEEREHAALREKIGELTEML